MFRSFGHSAPSRHSGRFLPRLEVLEDRLAPATRFWDGGATSNNWTSANNWSTNVAPVAGDDLVFPSNVSDKTADNTFPAGTLFNSITLGGGYTLRGNQIRLGGGGIVSQVSSNVINNDVNIGSGSTAPQVIQVTGGSTLFIDGNIVGGRELHKTGAGDLSFRANNDYTGLTDIKAGRLFIEKDEGLGTFNPSAGTIIRSGATLVVNDNALGTIRTDEPITIEGGGTIHGVNDAHLRGNLTTLGNGTLRHDGSVIERLLITGQISGAGGITIANASGAVCFQGEVSNTFAGLTTVNGKLRLDSPAGDSISGSLTINSTGAVRFDTGGQIHDDAVVTVNGGGLLLTNERDDSFRKLRLQGGLVDGYQLGLVDFLERIEFRLRNILFSKPSVLTVEEFEATSSTASAPAEILDVEILFQSESGVALVNDGPAFNDFIVHGEIFARNELNDKRLTLEGTGTTLIQDVAAFTYTVNGGLLRINKFERNSILFDSYDGSVLVHSGARFAGDAEIEGLHVFAGGRVRPGPLSGIGTLRIDGNLTLDPGAILEVTLNGSIGGSGHDQIDVEGSVSIDGAVIEPTLGPNAAVNQTYRVINNRLADGILGQFFVPPATAPFLNAPPTGQRLAFNYAGGQLNNDLVLTLQNTPPMAPDLALDRVELDEGGTVRATGRLVDPDPGDRLRLLVDWGDGSARKTFRPGVNPFALQHRYRDGGVYVARFEWLDQHGQGNHREFTVTVRNVAPQLQFNVLRQGNARVQLAGRVCDPGSGSLTLLVDFGDGSQPRQRSLGRGGFFTLKHRYAKPGTYSVTVTVTDGDGGSTTLQEVVTV